MCLIKILCDRRSFRNWQRSERLLCIFILLLRREVDSCEDIWQSPSDQSGMRNPGSPTSLKVFYISMGAIFLLIESEHLSLEDFHRQRRCWLPYVPVTQEGKEMVMVFLIGGQRAGRKTGGHSLKNLFFMFGSAIQLYVLSLLRHQYINSVISSSTITVFTSFGHVKINDTVLEIDWLKDIQLLNLKSAHLRVSPRKCWE